MNSNNNMVIAVAGFDPFLAETVFPTSTGTSGKILLVFFFYAA